MEPSTQIIPGPRSVLYIEDNRADARLLKTLLQEAAPNVELQIADSAEAATLRLSDCSVPLPTLILLDLGLPGLSGLEFLARLKADEATCKNSGGCLHGCYFAAGSRSAVRARRKLLYPEAPGSGRNRERPGRDVPLLVRDCPTRTC